MNKNAQIRKDSFEKILPSSKNEPNLVETDDGKEFSTEISTTKWNWKWLKYIVDTAQEGHYLLTVLIEPLEIY